MSKVVTRKQWGARPVPKSWYSSVVRKGYYRTHWTVGCSPRHEECDATMRSMQAYHIDVKGWTDIAYQECVCPHGWIFLGRGVDHRSAANGGTVSNSMWGAIALMAAPGCEATAVQLEAYAQRLQEHNAKGVGNHSDGYATSCPGQKISTWVNAKKWRAYEDLRSRTGWFAWFAWYQSEGDWDGKGKKQKGALTRPDVPKVIPPQWWVRRKRFLAKRVK